MRVDHAMILNVVNQPGDPVATMRALMEDNHEDEGRRAKLSEQAQALGSELLEAGVLEWLPEPDADGRTLRLAIELQENFALNQPLASFALVAFELLDPESETYALDVLSVVEAILDDPSPVLRAQANKAKGEAVAEMKAEGIEYDERMELLEEVTYPRPLAEGLEIALQGYRETRPWVREADLSPKSVVRDMYEQGRSFTEFVSFYGLARSEGLVLRYLSNAYRALRQTVPEQVKTDELDEIIEWLGETVRQTDSSLLDEWEALTDPSPSSARPQPRRRARRRLPRARSPATTARSRSWCATRCSSGSSSPRATGTTSSPSSRPLPPRSPIRPAARR
jgi:superfamily II RNA helicase